MDRILDGIFARSSSHLSGLPARGLREYRLDQRGSHLARARLGERGPMWFVTSEQTAGRGRRHRPWIAPRGNLASSILEVIDVSPAVAATLGFAAGLALEAALRKVSVEASLRSPGSDAYEVFAEMAQRRAGGTTKTRRHLAGSRGRCRRSAGRRGRASAPTSSRPRRACRRRRRRLRRSASMSARRNCSPLCRTRGRNFERFGTMAVALARSGGSGWSARRGSDSASRSTPPVPRRGHIRYHR